MTDLRAVVDRIEGDMAVVLVGDDSSRVVMPLNLLPEATKEGDVLKILIESDLEATQESKRHIQALIDKLREGDDG